SYRAGQLMQSDAQGRHRAWPHFRIWIEQENIVTLRLTERLIVGPAEASVVCVGDDANLGKLPPDRVRTAVPRPVVHHKNLTRKSAELGLQLCQAGKQAVPRVVVH